MTLIFKDPSFKVFLTFAKGFLSAKMTSNFLLDASRNQVTRHPYIKFHKSFLEMP